MRLSYKLNLTTGNLSKKPTQKSMYAHAANFPLMDKPGSWFALANVWKIPAEERNFT